MDKLTITKEIIKELGLEIEAEHALTFWWWPDSGTVQNSRLTKPGLQFISKALKGHTFAFEFKNTGFILNKLAKMNTPYYVDNGGIVLFSEKLATAVKLYPSFERYLELLNT